MYCRELFDIVLCIGCDLAGLLLVILLITLRLLLAPQYGVAKSARGPVWEPALTSG